MRHLILIFISILFLSCTVKVIPLKGKYEQPPFIFNSNLSKDSVWGRVIDLFAQEGLPIKIIDRSSGLIISDRYQLSPTIENKEGVILDKTALIVVPKFYNSGTRKYMPYYTGLSGEWNIRIKESGEASTINVNIVNVKNVYYDAYSKREIASKTIKYHSTGVFEKSIFDLLNKK